MDTSIHTVTDRPPLREPARRDRRRGGVAEFTLATTARPSPPPEAHEKDHDAGEARAVSAHDESGDHLDVLG